ncbi:hypothetical protein BDP55DRAFT_207632 [Colletotrichum godetiae]|uniref:Uncharacterized protein n=1 Tax=Colletotrichum godetiae TaxID=1209918 RepID=A0AAJ0F3V2_9PEZI|nr:uncharacterized protein BDP55DRAFT_207632 [Colletotrichum godetiae]KAK1699795.1 hypothetical protein BDP55DRAFT_207632 [Colletotrichum godetiae]
MLFHWMPPAQPQTTALKRAGSWTRVPTLAQLHRHIGGRSKGDITCGCASYPSLPAQPIQHMSLHDMTPHDRVQGPGPDPDRM